jgi:hypothetical protein
MAQVYLPQKDFEEVDIYTRKYSVRYRIISDNKNNLSVWSPIFQVDPGFDFIASGNVVVERTSNQTTASWIPVQIEKNGNNIGTLEYYDVWTRWGNNEADGSWGYYQRVSGSSINIIKPVATASVNYFSVEVYRPMRPRDYRITLYEIDQSSAGEKIDLVKDQITLPAGNVVVTGDGLRYTSETPMTGLITSTVYYARKESSNVMTLYPTKADAVGNINKINISAYSNDLGYFQWEESTVYDFLLYSAYNIPSA